MYSSLQFLHSYWAYLTLLIVLIATLNALVGFFSNKNFSPKNLRIFLFALIVTHIQIILGLVLYLVSPNAIIAIKNNGMGEVMKDSALRFSSIEHPLIMIIAVILITIGFSKHKKKNTSEAKFKTLAIFYTLALLLILSRIPWVEWFN